MLEEIRVSRLGASWAIKHQKSILGHAATRDEAAQIARGLVDWLAEQGRPAELVLEEPRSYSPRAPAPSPRPHTILR
jgi:hypothetical protein